MTSQFLFFVPYCILCNSFLGKSSLFSFGVKIDFFFFFFFVMHSILLDTCLNISQGDLRVFLNTKGPLKPTTALKLAMDIARSAIYSFFEDKSDSTLYIMVSLTLYARDFNYLIFLYTRMFHIDVVYETRTSGVQFLCLSMFPLLPYLFFFCPLLISSEYPLQRLDNYLFPTTGIEMGDWILNDSLYPIRKHKLFLPI